MQSHCINAEAVDALLKDDFTTFFNERKKTIMYEFKTTGFVQNIIDQQPSDDEED
jgi:phosphoribosyl-AMP cyclohydrolase